MKKRWLSITAALCVCVAFMSGCQSASEPSSPSSETSGQSNSELVFSGEEGTTSIVGEPSSPDTSGSQSITAGLDVFNVRIYGANGNGQGDDSGAIQQAVDAASSAGGGIVYLPHGEYAVKSTILKKAKVSMIGDNMQSTILKWVGDSDGVMIDTSNQALWGTSIENLSFTTASVSGVTGILGGSTFKVYNSAIGTFKNLSFSSLDYGIRGDAVAYESRGIGIFDCNFENIFVSGAKKGIWLCGSGNTIVHPRVVGCDAGLVLDYLSGESIDGVHVIGGIFIQNKVDVFIPNGTFLRPTNFVGTWFEQSSEGIVKVLMPGSRVQTLVFRDCMLSTNDDVPSILDFSNIGDGNVIVDGCSIMAKNPSIVPPQYGGKLAERDNYIC